MRKIIIIILLILLIPFFIITIKDIDREEVNPSLDLTLTETHNSIIELNNYTLREVFEDTSLFDSLQIITNGDFLSLTGWTSHYSTSTTTDGILINTAKGTGNIGYVETMPGTYAVGQKLYIFSRLRVTNENAVKLKAYIYDGSNLFYAVNQTAPIINKWYVGSIVATLTNTSLQAFLRHEYPDNTTANGAVMEGDYLYAFNISTLIANKQYSPLYKTTFDLMSDAEIKAQMDEFVAKPYLFLDYETLGLDDLLISNTDMDYWYNVYTTYSPSYDTIQFGTATAGDYLLLQQLIIDNASKDFKLYRDDVIDEVHYTMTQNIDNISVSDVNGNELFILYPDDTYISRVSLSDTTTLSFVGYNITGYIDGDFNNTVLAFFWIVPILLVGALFFIIFKGKESE